MNIRQLLNLLTVLLTIGVNGLANALPINNQTTGEISDRFPVLFTPAGYVFSIWGLIYLALLAFAIYQALPAQRKNPRLERVGYWFVAANLFNGAWIFFWHYNLFALTLLVMVGLLVSLIMVYRRLEIGISKAPAIEKWVVDFPFSLYLGWISVATIANGSVFLYDLGWNGEPLGPVFWTVLVLVVGAILGGLMILRRNDWVYPLVLAWAFAGIVVKQADTFAVALTAGLAALAVVVVLVLSQIPGSRLARA